MLGRLALILVSAVIGLLALELGLRLVLKGPQGLESGPTSCATSAS